MARPDIDLPERFVFVTRVPVRIDDINYGGHLGNESVLSLAQEARVRFFGAHGWTELDIEGIGILMVDASVLYKAEGQYGMTLRIEVGAGEVRTRGCDLVYRLTEEATGEEIARVKTGLVFQDRSTRRLVRMPQKLRDVLGVVPPTKG
jgi:acyl-CoA thioester hydrolase